MQADFDNLSFLLKKKKLKHKVSKMLIIINSFICDNVTNIKIYNEDLEKVRDSCYRR